MAQNILIPPMVSVVILHSEHSQSLAGMLSCLRRQSYPYMEIIVVDADVKNETEVDLLVSQYPEVKFIPFFEKPDYIEMLRRALRAIKGGYSLIVNLEVDIPKAGVELMVTDMRKTPELKVMTIQIFESKTYLRGYTTSFLPWVMIPNKIATSDSMTPILQDGISAEFLYMTTTQSLIEIVSNTKFKSEWGFFHWQLQNANHPSLIGISTDMTARVHANHVTKHTKMPLNFQEGFQIIDLVILGPFRWIHYMIYTIAFSINSVGNSFRSIKKKLHRMQQKQHFITT